MQTDWSLIQKKLVAYCKSAFHQDNIVIDDAQLEDAILLFRRFVLLRTDYALINGLGSELMTALQSSCVDAVGDFSGLRTLATTADSFFKRLLVCTGKSLYRDIEGKMLYELINLTGVYSPMPSLKTANSSDYMGSGNGLALVIQMYQTRNLVHTTPDWDDSEVTGRVKYVVASYIYFVYIFRSLLLEHLPQLNVEVNYQYHDSEESQLMYDFVSYGKSTNKIKNQIIISYVSHWLYNNGGATIVLLKQRILSFSDGSLSDASADRIIKRLIESGKLVYTDIGKTKVDLCDEEKERLKNIISDYQLNYNEFCKSIASVLESYHIEDRTDEWIGKLCAFFENNYGVDIDEYCDFGDREKLSLDYLFNEVSALGIIDTYDRECLIRESLAICRSNDIIIRISAGKALSRLTNPELFESQIRTREHMVYLDTQVLLYALCINDDYGDFDNVRFRIAKALIEYARSSQFVTLCTTNEYINEVVYHLRAALLLIQFDEISLLRNTKLSNNVFYSHYFDLKKNDLLPEDIVSFADYLDLTFNLRIDDVFSGDFNQIARSQVELILTKELGIRIESIIVADEKLNSSRRIFDEVSIDNKLQKKHGAVADNDAKMGAYLFDWDISTPDPFFITWDNSFYFFRQAYFKRYVRRHYAGMWKLFTPARFLNHVDLINFKVNASALTDDILSMIENDYTHADTQTFFDRINKYFATQQYSRSQRTKYIQWFASLVNEGEFISDWESAPDNNDTLIDILPRYLSERSTSSFVLFKQIIVESEGFEKFTEISNRYSSNKNLETRKEDALNQIDELLSSYER